MDGIRSRFRRNCGVVLIAFGKDIQGLATILTTLAALAGVFVYGRYQQNKERADKRAEQQQLRLPLDQ